MSHITLIKVEGGPTREMGQPARLSGYKIVILNLWVTPLLPFFMPRKFPFGSTMYTYTLFTMSHYFGPFQVGESFLSHKI